MSARGKIVLVLEDEVVLRSSMVAGLSKLAGVSVIGASTVREAVALLDGYPPDVVVSDIDLPDGLGVQLIGELAKRGLAAPILFVTAYRAAYGSLIPPHAGVTVLEKPVSLEDLRSVVASKLGTDAPPSPFTVADYVQLSCMGKHSVTIDIEWNGNSGRVEIVNGDLWSAADPAGDGEAAFRRVAFKRDARITCYASDAAPGERNIVAPWESVLMDSARVLDEEKRDGEDELSGGFDLGDFDDASQPAAAAPVTTPAPAAPVTSRAPPEPTDTLPSRLKPTEPPTDPVADAFAAHCDRAIAALLTKDYKSAAAAFGQARELRPEDPLVNTNLARLKAMGFGSEGEG
ncbi:MAG: response regulator [Polyangiaceae bacterium]